MVIWCGVSCLNQVLMFSDSFGRKMRHDKPKFFIRQRHNSLYLLSQNFFHSQRQDTTLNVRDNTDGSDYLGGIGKSLLWLPINACTQKTGVFLGTICYLYYYIRSITCEINESYKISRNAPFHETKMVSRVSNLKWLTRIFCPSVGSTDLLRSTLLTILQPSISTLQLTSVLFAAGFAGIRREWKRWGFRAYDSADRRQKVHRAPKPVSEPECRLG